jgi:hypothetical protein
MITFQILFNDENGARHEGKTSLGLRLTFASTAVKLEYEGKFTQFL